MTLRKKSILLFFTTTIILLLLASSSHINNIMKNNQAFIPLNSSLKDSGDIKPSKFAYLTFDDGPTYVVTAALLDVLKKAKCKSYFFCSR